MARSTSSAVSLVVDPAEATLLGALSRWERTSPDRTYLVDVAGPRTSYAEAAASSRIWAAAWRRLGIAEGDAVVTMQLNTTAAHLSWLGLSWLRAVEVPVNVDYRGRLLVHALQLTQSSVMGVEARYAPRLAEVADQLDHLKTVVILDQDESIDLPFEVVTRSELLVGVGPLPDAQLPEPWDPAVVLFTSGTTGASKAVPMPWAQLHATASGVLPIEDLTEDDVFFNPGPTYHLGSRSIPFLTALVGGRQVVAPFLSRSELGSLFTDHGVTTAGALPPDWLAADPRPDDGDRPLRNLIAPIRIPGIDAIKERFGLRSFGCFSMTEISVPIRDRGWDQARYDDAGRMSCGSVREGYPGYEVRVVDEHDLPVPPGAVGELVVRTEVPWTLSGGYLNMPEATSNAWRNGWFHTGDAFIADEGGSLFFIDRLKDSIRRHGENISSVDVETHLLEHPKVKEVAAVAARHGHTPGADEDVHVFVVPAHGDDVSPEELVTWLIPRMPRFMIPRYVDIVETLPRTPTMKVKKAELRERGVQPSTWDRELAGISIPR